MELSGLIFFILGFIIGGIIIWFLRQNEFEATRKGQDHLKQTFSDLSNDALEQKIILCSPITLYAVLSLITQAISNFSIDKKQEKCKNMLASLNNSGMSTFYK